MKILIFHGYLLRGTGSNIYNANLARAFAGLGHDVHLLCQDREAEDLDWVNRVGTWPQGRLEVEPLRPAPAGNGSITVYRPGIGRVLPVYVEDPYEGFEARAYPRLGDGEIENYIEVNAAAVGDILRSINGADVALANHLIMGPVILARAGVEGYVVKNHGSDLEYTVKPNPRFLPWVEEGLDPAVAVLSGSWHTAVSLWEAVPELPLREKSGLGPPGADPESFAPVVPERRRDRLLTEAARIAADEQAGTFGRDETAAAAALEQFADADGPRVIFVGKLIVSKGVDLLLAAWPLIHRENPGAELLVAGFGAYEIGLRAMVTALGEGDRDSLIEIAERGRELEGGEPGTLSILKEFLDALPDGYLEAARPAAGAVSFSGRLEHGEVARTVPCADAMVVPSTFPEAFGMVAAEAAVAGALPVCANHSGLAEVAGALADDIPEIRDLTSFDLGPDAIPALASRVNRWLDLDPAESARIGRDIAECAARKWSWTGVAEDVISASHGEIRALHPG
ncbi:MAG: glycosyltransferase [Solirubrobacterales bacterium]|nr:glycosyltransferase [Solirubrobacterales bacterium]